MNYITIFLSLVLCTEIIGASERWIDPSQGKTKHVYLGAPGMFSSEAQFAKLTPHFTASTGETVRCERGIQVVPSTLNAQNLGEISLSRTESQEAWACLLKAAPLIPFSMLLRSSTDGGKILYALSLMGYTAYAVWRPLNFLASAAAHKKFGISFEGKPKGNESIRHHAINPFKINVAQEDDVNLYLTAFNRLTGTPDGQKKAILYGISRGSATVFESFAQLSSQNKSDTIGAVICEGIFDSVPNTLRHAPFLQRIKLCALMNLGITQFKPQGMSPLSVLTNITEKDKPIALITSMADGEVPYQNTLNLYQQLRKAGHGNTHILILNHAGHCEYALGNEKEKYQAFIHAFYRKYDLPYITKFADEGQNYLTTSQPSY